MITSPISYSPHSSEIVDSYNRRRLRDKAGSYWDHADVSAVRAEIKQYYERAQNYQCCYCQMPLLSSHGRVWDAEHVVPRSTHPRFLFQPQNLAASCVDCNSAKGDAPTIVGDRSPARYPNSSDHFVIIHPHFDRYEDHISIFLGKIYSPRTPKGMATVVMCGLLRYAFKFGEWDAGNISVPDLLQVASQLTQELDPAAQRAILANLVLLAQVQLSRTLLPRPGTTS